MIFIEEIEEYLHNKYGVRFTVEENENGFEITCEDNHKLAYNLGLLPDSQEYWESLESIQREINSSFSYGN